MIVRVHRIEWFQSLNLYSRR